MQEKNTKFKTKDLSYIIIYLIDEIKELEEL